MATVINVARPPLEMTVTFVLVADPIGLPLEHLRITTSVPGTSEWLYIFVHVFSQKAYGIF